MKLFRFVTAPSFLLVLHGNVWGKFLFSEQANKLPRRGRGLATGTALLGRFGGSDSPPDCHSVPPHPRVPDVGAPGGQQKNKFDECG